MALKLLPILLILVLHLKTPEGHWIPHWPPSRKVNPNRPLCSSQFALVNRACLVMPYTPVPDPPAPPSPSSPEDEQKSSPHGHRHHHHGHGHRRHEYRAETPEEEECCRWLKEVDNECVCELLVHLPLFLTRPAHNYNVVLDEFCEVTFQCSSKFVE